MPPHAEDSRQALVVLVVTNAPAAVGITEALAAHGHRVLTAPNGAEAVARSAADPPHAVVLDLMMPRVNAVELAGRLRTGAPADRCPVLVALSGWRGAEIRRWAAEGGFDALLPDTPAPAVLLAALEALRKRKTAPPLRPVRRRSGTRGNPVGFHS
jgi:CheY-like chemotaxis protein